MAKDKSKGKKNKNKQKGRVISVDFTEAGSGPIKVPEGDYQVKVVGIEEEISEKSSQPYLLWELEITEGKFKGKTLRHRTSLQTQSLWVLRDTLEALGVEVPAKAADLNLDDYIGLEMGVTVEFEEYQGKRKSAVVDVFSLDEMDDSGDDEDDDDDDSEDEDDEDDDDEGEEEEPDYSEMDEKELKALCKERDIKVSKKDTKKKLIKKLEEYDEEDV